MDISVTAEILNNIEVEVLLQNTVFQVVQVQVLPAPLVGSISTTDLAKSIAGQTFTITGANFDASTVITSTAGTVTGIVVNSANSVSVTITGGTGTGYKDVTATTTAGTHTLSNCIRMYTRVIPGTDVSWLDVTGTGTVTGAGYIRQAYGYGPTKGASFSPCSDNSDFDITFVSDETVLAATNHRGAFGVSNVTPNTLAGGTRYVSQDSYSSNQNPAYINFKSTKTYAVLLYHVPVLTAATVYSIKRRSGNIIYGYGGQDVFQPTAQTTSAIYIDFCVYDGGAGYKNILAKVYN